MYDQLISQAVPTTQVVIPVSHNAGTVGSGEVDLLKFRQARFCIAVGAMTSTATLDVSLVGSNTSGTAVGSKTAITSTSVTQFTAAGSAPVGPSSFASIVITMEGSAYRYVEAKIVVANAAVVYCAWVEGIIARYEPASGQQVTNSGTTPATTTNIAQTPVVAPNLSAL